MHLSRMRTAAAVAVPGGGGWGLHQAPLGAGTPLGPDHLLPRDQIPPRSRHPPGPDPPPQGAGTPRDQTTLWDRTTPLGPGTRHPLVNRITDTCKKYYLPFAVSNKTAFK